MPKNCYVIMPVGPNGVYNATDAIIVIHKLRQQGYSAVIRNESASIAECLQHAAAGMAKSECIYLAPYYDRCRIARAEWVMAKAIDMPVVNSIVELYLPKNNNPCNK